MYKSFTVEIFDIPCRRISFIIKERWFGGFCRRRLRMHVRLREKFRR